MTLGVPVPTHVYLTVPRVVAELLVGPARTAYPMPRPYGESVNEIRLWLHRWRVHPDVTDRTWPNDEERDAVARRLRFLLYRLEREGWTP